MGEMEKDIQLGYFEKVLGRGKAINVRKLDRGKHPLAYPMKKNFEAYYVLYSFAGPTTLPALITDFTVNPGIDSEGQFLRINTVKQAEDSTPPTAKAGGEQSSTD